MIPAEPRRHQRSSRRQCNRRRRTRPLPDLDSRRQTSAARAPIPMPHSPTKSPPCTQRQHARHEGTV
eukprot:3530988-Alexandrium_andersonii.AAC.1